MQTPFAAWLKMTFPQCRITFLTSDGNEAILQGNPYIDEVLTYTRALGMADVLSVKKFTRKVLALKKFDCLIDLHTTARSALIRFFLPEVLSLKMDKRRFERELLVKTKIDLLGASKENHLVHRHLHDLAWSFNQSYDPAKLLRFIRLKFKAHDSLLTSSVSALETSGQDSVILAPGASFSSKKWPIENFVQLAQQILSHTELNCVVIAGPQDVECRAFDQLERRYPKRLKNYQGKLSVLESMSQVAAGKLIVCNDSFFGHVAQSCSIPAFTIFGSTSSSFGFGPLGENSRSYEASGLWCRPCSTTGKRACFRKRHYCMLAIEVKTIWDDVSAALSKQGFQIALGTHEK